MSLINKKTINSIKLESTSTINGTDVVKLSTTVDNSASYSNTNQQVIDQPTYDANLSAVRKDILAFQQVVFDVQDELDANQGVVINDDGTVVDTNDSSAATSSSASASSVAK